MRHDRIAFGILILSSFLSYCKTESDKEDAAGSIIPATEQPKEQQDVQNTPAQEKVESPTETPKRTADYIPPNGAISVAEIKRTSGNAISGRTQTGTATSIPHSESFLRNMGSAFTQLYDIYSDNFAVGSIGKAGTFEYVLYINSTLGYINPTTQTLMYCEPQIVSKANDVVAILDCMNALPLSKVSKTAKYGNGNAIFNAKGELLYEDGTLALSGSTWNSVTGTPMFINGFAYYGNKQVMYDKNGNAFFSSGNLAFNKASGILKFENDRDFVNGSAIYYKNGANLFKSGSNTDPTASYYYQGTPQKVLIKTPLPNNTKQNIEVFYKNGIQAFKDGKVYRDDGSEAPVEVYAVEETAQDSIIWSVSQLYLNLSISQYTKESTFNVILQYETPNQPPVTAPPKDPINLTFTPTSTNSIVAQWANGGDTTGFTYVMVPGNQAPSSCTGGNNIGLNMSVTFTGLLAETDYSIRVCARNQAGVLSAGTTAKTRTLAPSIQFKGNILSVGSRLNANQGLITPGSSKTCPFALVMQQDGNLVLKRNDKILWQTNTSGKGPAYLTLTPYRNLVLSLSSANAPTPSSTIWSTKTASIQADPKARLILQSNGNLVLASGLNGKIWSSNTAAADCK